MRHFERSNPAHVDQEPRRLREDASLSLSEGEARCADAGLQGGHVGALGARRDRRHLHRQQRRPEPDAELRDNENVPLKEDIQTYFKREVLPHVPDAWIDESKTKIGYEIPFTRHFYRYKALRPLEEIEGEIRALEAEIQGMLGEVLR